MAGFWNYIITRLISRYWGLYHHVTLTGRGDPVLPPLVELFVFFSPQHEFPPSILVSILRVTVTIRALGKCRSGRVLKIFLLPVKRAPTKARVTREKVRVGLEASGHARCLNGLERNRTGWTFSYKF